MSSSTRIPHAEPQPTQSAQSYELDEASTREYLRLIASLHKTWDTLESQSSASVMPQRHMMDAVIAETRHGAQVEMPPTDLGPYSMSEFSLRALVRRSVDSVPGARALRSSFKHARSAGAPPNAPDADAQKFSSAPHGRTRTRHRRFYSLTVPVPRPHRRRGYHGQAPRTRR